jgi:ATP-dependent helicase/nuclease subunit A
VKRVRLADDAARDLIAGRSPAPAGRGGHEQTLFVEAGAGSGKTRSLVERILALLRDGQTTLDRVAAITFTEKAATELRERVRSELERQLADAGLDRQVRARFEDALTQVDVAAICTLHAFAQRILNEHPIEAGLPPLIEVLDEVASQIDFDTRWREHRRRLLDDPTLVRTLRLALGLRIDLDKIRSLAIEFDRNWDLARQCERIPWAADDIPPLAVEELLAHLDALIAMGADCRDTTDRLLAFLDDDASGYAARLRRAPDDEERLRILSETKPSFRLGSTGQKRNWEDIGAVRDAGRELAELRKRVCSDTATAIGHRLAVAVRDVVVDTAEGRRRDGRLAFHDLLVLARQLLRGPDGPAVRRSLRGRYEYLLLDEFQDTDPIQIELAVLLASPDDEASGRPWQAIVTDPGRLFFVGDPKQSIYRFRRADIELYLHARKVFAGDSPVQLTTNFRSAPGVLAWVNHTFDQLIRSQEGLQPAYQRLDPAPGRTDPAVGPTVAVLGGEVVAADTVDAEGIRALEAAAVADAVVRAISEGWTVSQTGRDDERSWRDARLGDVTILLPARTSLHALEHALDERGIPYRAANASLVYSTTAVREVITTLRAIADPTDQLALVTALRSPLFGCGDDDLVTFRLGHGGRFDLTGLPPESLPADHPVGAALRYLRGLHRAATWSTPSELLDRLCRERRLYELALATRRPRDVWRRLRFVTDQARAWSEAGGTGLRNYLEWAGLQASDSARVAEAILPETDDDSVRIMTVHAAKGLQFPITILSGTTSRPGGGRRGVRVVWPDHGPAGIELGRNARTSEFEDFKPIDEQMDHHERLRLLYVACTRAEDHLVVSLFRKQRKANADERDRTNAELLAMACEGAPGQQPLALLASTAGEVPAQQAHGLPPDGAAPRIWGRDAEASEIIPFDEWETQRREAVTSSARARSLAASRLTLPPSPAAGSSDQNAEGDVGLQKQGRDLELPAWQKGRYGDAIGRAVHAVLQTIDLETGDGLAEAAAGQAAAEGLLGREQDIAYLANSALASPAVRASLEHPRWRETYVATTIGDTTLEGYIDLMYRTASGLVIVDYKTASSRDDLDVRVEHYRGQGAAYAVAVEAATGESVAEVVFAFLTPDGPVDRQLEDLVSAKEQITARATA